MSQATNPSIASGQTGTQYRTQDNDRYSAALTKHSGSTRPTYAVAGTEWLDTSATPWVVKVFDGTDDISTGTINATTNLFVPYGFSTSDSPQFAGVNIGHASDTTITRTGAGDIAVEGNAIYRAGGTDVPVTDGGTGLSSATAYAVLCGGTTSTGAFQSVSSVGTAGQVLTSNGAGALPTFQTPAGSSGALVFIDSATASSSASLGFTSGLSSTYDSYLILLEGLTPATDGVILRMRVYSGGSFQTTSYNWNAELYGEGNQRFAQASAAAYIQCHRDDGDTACGGNPGNASTESVAGEVFITNPSSTALRKMVHGELTFIGATSARPSRSNFSGDWNSASAITGFQFFFSSGNIASGSIRLYGIAKS